MRKLIGLFCLVCAVSCQDPLVNSLPRFMREQDHHARGERGDTSARPPWPDPDPDPPVYVPSVYATALHFRDSVNWRLDSLGAAEVLFFKDGELVESLPVPSPPDPERHRIWGGQLWTDYTDGHETVLLCDGNERFRFQGEEQLRGFLIVDGKVHTLGQHPGKGGFCYRIDGEPVFSLDKGSVLGSPSTSAWKGGALNLDGNDIYFCYRVNRDYYIMKGAETFRVLHTGTSDILYEARVYGGHLWRNEKTGNTFSLYCDDQVRRLRLLASHVLSCRLVPAREEVSLLGCSLTGNGGYAFWLTSFETGNFFTRNTGQSLKSEMCYRDPDILFADIDAEGRIQKLLYNQVEQSLEPGVYTCASPLDLYLSENHFAAALTHSGSGPHLLLYDGKEYPLSFNGYFTSVILE
jgi:hypothetical protein